MKNGLGYSVLIKGRRGTIYESKVVGDPGNINEKLWQESADIRGWGATPNSGENALQALISASSHAKENMIPVIASGGNLHFSWR